MPSTRAGDAVAACLDEVNAAIEAHDDRHLSPARRRIIEATIEASRGKQVSDVSLRDIAKIANIQAASLYSHFPNGKLELFVDAFSWHYVQFLRAVHAGVLAENSASARLSGLIASHVRDDFETSDSSPNKVLPDLWTPRVFQDQLTAQVQEGIAELPNLYRRLVAAVLRENGLKDNESQVVALVVMLLNRLPEWDPRATKTGLTQSIALSDKIVRSIIA